MALATLVERWSGGVAAEAFAENDTAAVAAVEVIAEADTADVVAEAFAENDTAAVAAVEVIAEFADVAAE